MQNRRPAGVQVFFVLVFLLATAPAMLHAQSLTLVQSGARFAGNNQPGFNTDFGSATTVNLTPSNLVFDTLGNLYVSDTQNNCVRKINSSGTISTVVGLTSGGQGGTCNAAGSAPDPTLGLYQPTGLAVDTSNNLYIADSKHNCIRELPNNATGVASLITVAGTCGSATSTTPTPNGIAIDSGNNLYISIQDAASSTYQVLRQLSPTSLCVMAGAPSTLVPSLCSGITSNVTLHTPSGIAIDASGNLFIADTGNNCIREVANLTTQQTPVGQCANDHTGNADTALNSPQGLAFSPSQFLYITESGANNNNVVSYAPNATALAIVAGLPSGASGPYSSTQDGISALSAPLTAPTGLISDSTGNLYVADTGNYIVRKLSSNVLFPTTNVGSPSASLPITFSILKNVTLTASAASDFKITSNTCTGSLSASPSGTSPTTCQVFLNFNPTQPGARSAALKLTDSISNTSIAVGLQATALGALGVFTPGTVNTAAASLPSPTAVAVDSTGDAYVLQAGTTPGAASLLLRPAGGGPPQTISPAPGVTYATPSAIALDAAGNLFLADSTLGTVSRFGIDGTINTSFVTGLDHPSALFLDSFDNLYIAQAGTTHNVIEVYLSGTRRTVSGSGTFPGANGVPATTASFVSPSGLYIDSNGVLYIADAGGHFVYAIDKTGLIHQVAGNGTTTTTIPGQATGTALLHPDSIAVDAAGDINISDSAANLVYTVFTTSSSTGANIAIALGTGSPGNTGDGGLANAARIDNPTSLALDSNADLFLVDSGNSSLREITYPSPTLAFGSVMIGQTSPVLIQSVSNFGTDNLTLTMPISTSDPHFAVDPNTTTCGATIITGSTCNIGFTFTPTVVGLVNGATVLSSNASNSPQTIQLTGSGSRFPPIQYTLPAQTEVYGQPFPETAAIANINPANAAPTGTITFTTGSKTLCTLTATFGPTNTCNAPASGLAVGSYPVIFTYSGDTNYPASSGATTLTVTPAPLTVTVNSATRPLNQPNPTFTGTITGVVAGDTVQAVYSTTATISSPAGTYPIIATLTPGTGTNLSNYTITNTPGTLTIAPQTGPLVTSTTLTTSGSPAATGASVTFTATVTTPTGVPAGVVIFTDGSTVLGQQTLAANGIATLSTSTLAAGTHTITASFQATSSFAASAASLTQVITGSTPPSGSFTIAASPATQFLTGAGTTTYQITLTSTGVFAGQVALTCSGLPSDASCSFASNPTLTAGGTATTTLTVTTTAADAALRTPANLPPAILAPLTAAVVFPIELTGFGIFFTGFTRRKTQPAQKMRLLAFLAFSLGILGLTGCCFTNASFKTYTITVTGTSVSAAAPAQSTTVLLSVGTK